jgi:hypothetical protein
VTDHFTKWVRFYAIKDITARTIAKYLVEFFLSYGIPESILTDQGTNFMSELLDEIYMLLDIQKLKTTAYHPECDGQSERNVQTMKEMIKHFIEKDQKNRDILLPKLAFAYNTATQAATKKTPFELEFGDKPKVPLDLFIHANDDETRSETIEQLKANGKINASELVLELDSELYAKKLQDELKEAFETVNDTKLTYTDRMKINYDRKTHAANFNVGEKVLLRNTATTVGENKKLAAKYTGPFIITKKLVNNLDFEIKGEGARAKRKVVHANRLKKWYENLNNNANVNERLLEAN